MAAPTREELLYPQATVIQYRAYCTYLLDTCEKAPIFTNKIQQELKKGLYMAEKLENIFLHLNEPQEVTRFHKHQKIFKTLLNDKNHKAEPPTPGEVTQSIRSATFHLNFPRLFTVRLLRVLRNITRLSENSTFTQYIRAIDNVLNPALIYLSWIFFAPRLLLNTGLMLKHLIPYRYNPFMTKEEDSLDANTRFWSHLNVDMRWFFLINDVVWFTGGLVGCFILTGPLLPISLYLAIGLQCFDLVFACIRYCIEANRLNQLTTNMPHDAPAYKKDLDAHIEHEKRPHRQLIYNHCALLLSIITLLPSMVSISPFLPILGASLSVATTIINYSKNLDHGAQQPKCDPRDLTKFSMFHPSPKTMHKHSSELQLVPQF